MNADDCLDPELVKQLKEVMGEVAIVFSDNSMNVNLTHESALTSSHLEALAELCTRLAQEHKTEVFENLKGHIHICVNEKDPSESHFQFEIFVKRHSAH
jgi:hypothetical protein